MKKVISELLLWVIAWVISFLISSIFKQFSQGEIFLYSYFVLFFIPQLHLSISKSDGTLYDLFLSIITFILVCTIILLAPLAISLPFKANYYTVFKIMTFIFCFISF